MENNTWNKFKKTRERFRRYVETLSETLPDLGKVQQELVNGRSEGKNSAYIVETPVVYNRALDDVKVNDEIKIILVADNPGRREQVSENRRYLTGPSGKIAERFFADNPSLGIDFKRNVIILNKTPVHTPRTVELRDLYEIKTPRETNSENSAAKNSPEKDCLTLKAAVEKSQKFMASLLLDFHQAFSCPVWITGYSEMKKGRIFEAYTEELKRLYKNSAELIENLFIYRHFSMNQFTIDLKQQAIPGESVKKSLKRIGESYRNRILGNI